MEKEVKAIVENGILGLLEEYYDWYGEANDNAKYIFDILFENEELKLSQKGKEVAELWSKSIKNSCSTEEVTLAYNCASNKESELNDDFYGIFPKMFAAMLTEIKALKAENGIISDEKHVAFQVIDYLGKQIFGANKFVKMVREEVDQKNENDKQASL